MKKLLIAFDVDGTLRDNTNNDRVVPNERVCRQLMDMSHAKNTKIMVWSGGGELYARQCTAALGLDSYVDMYADKQATHDPVTGEWHFGYDGPQPDIAFDDMQDFALGKINIIVREK